MSVYGRHSSLEVFGWVSVGHVATSLNQAGDSADELGVLEELKGVN